MYHAMCVYNKTHGWNAYTHIYSLLRIIIIIDDNWRQVQGRSSVYYIDGVPMIYLWSNNIISYLCSIDSSN